MVEVENWEKQESAGMWMPEKEMEELVGEVADIQEGGYGLQYSIKKEDGNTILTPSHKVLQSRMLKVRVGDIVKIVYKGEEPPSVKGRNPTKMYEVYKATK